MLPNELSFPSMKIICGSQSYRPSEVPPSNTQLQNEPQLKIAISNETWILQNSQGKSYVSALYKILLPAIRLYPLSRLSMLSKDLIDRRPLAI